jgi:hypothetical protein
MSMHQSSPITETHIQLIASAAVAAFGVGFLWNFWEKFVYALGVNFAIFLAGIVGVCIWQLYRKGKYTARDLVWVVPLLLMALSVALYDNPFMKAVLLVVWPFSFAVLFNYAILENKGDHTWNLGLASSIAERILKTVTYIGKAVTSFLEVLIPANRKYKKIIARLLLGLGLFGLLALTVFIPLLSSADNDFGVILETIVEWVIAQVSLPLTYRILTGIVVAVGCMAILLAWSSPFDLERQSEKKEQVDDIVAGSFLSGVVTLYVLFIGVQVSKLWVGALPIDFDAVVTLVKSGFWQLLVLTFLNILIFYFVYKKTGRVVQWILGFFAVASLLLLASAGHRMGLYVQFYGFSYEKFYASYTVLFCGVLLLWLIAELFSRRKVDSIHFAAVLFIWMISVVSILPVEQFILRSNMKLVQREGSQIRLYELTMLSPDVLKIVKKYNAAGQLTERVGTLPREEVSSGIKRDWQPWIRRQEERLAQKEWYEFNLMNVLNK